MASPAAILSILLQAKGVEQTTLHLRKVQQQAERTANSTDKLEQRFSHLDNTVGDFNRTMLGLQNVVGIVKWPALIAGAGAAAQAIGALSAGAIGLVSALAPLAGTGAAAAAGFVAMGQGLGVLKLAFMDIGKAIKTYTTAQQKVTQAQDAVTAAADKYGKASSQYKSAVKAQTTANQALQQSLATLTPSQRAFAEQVIAAQGQLAKLKEAAAGGLLPGLGKALQNVMPLFGELKTIVGNTAKEFGDLAVQVSASVRTWGPDLATIGKTNVGVLHNLGEAAISFGDAAKNVVVVAGPLLTWITKMIQAGADWVDIQVKAGRESGRLAAFLEQTRDVMNRLWHIAVNVGTALFNIGRAAAPLGRQLLGSIQGVTQKWADWTGSLTGQNQLRQYFNNAKPSIDALAGLIGDLAKAVVGISQAPGLPGLVGKIRTVISGLQSLVTNTTAAFGPVLIDALSNIVRLLSQLGGANGPLTLTIQVVGFLAGALATLLAHNPQLNSMVVSMLGLAGAVKVLSFFLGPAAKGMLLFGSALVALSGATSGATLATIALSAAMDALPFIAIGVAIAAFIAGMILLYNHVKVARDIMNAAWAQIKAVAMNVFGGLKDFFAGWIKVIVGFVQVFKGVFTLHFGEAWDGVKKIFTGAIQAILGYLKALFAPVLVAMKAVGKAISDPISDAWRTLKKVVSDAIAWILNAFGDMLDGFAGVLKAMASVPVIGKAFKGVADEVQNAADKVHGLADAINKVPPKVSTEVDVHVNFLSNVSGAIASIGATITNVGAKVAGATPVTGAGHRYMGGLVDTPGYFAGEEAPQHPEVIVATNPAYRSQNLGYWAMAGRMLGIPGFASGGLANAASMVSATDPWAQSHAGSWAAGKAKTWVHSQFPSAGAMGGGTGVSAGVGGAGVPAGSPRDWLTRALQITNHYSPANLAALYGRMLQESGGNPHAINLWDSNAAAGHPSKGLLQTIDSTFNSYALPGYGNIWNPIANAIAAIRYMFAGYGHIVGPSGSGYRKGGIHGKIPGFAKGGIPSAGSIIGLPALPTLAGAGPQTATGIRGVAGTISGTRGSIASLEQSFSAIDSFYNLNSGASFVDPDTGLRDENAIKARVDQLNTLIAYRQRIFAAWGMVVALTQRLIEANERMARVLNAVAQSITTKGLKGNALTSAQKRLSDTKVAAAQYATNAGAARGALSGAIGDRQSAWISLQSLLGEKFTTAGTVSQPVAAVTAALDNSPVTDPATIALLQAQVQQANLRTAVSQAQYATLPFGGSFATGGIVPGALGMPSVIVAHGGETVTPAGQMRVVIEDHRTRVYYDDVEQIVNQVTRGSARNASRSLPGSR